MFRLKKPVNDTAIKDLRNLFRPKKENKAIKNRVIRDIRNLFEPENEEAIIKLNMKLLVIETKHLKNIS